MADQQLIMEKFLPCQPNSKIKHIDFRFPENRKEEFDKTVASDSTLSISSIASKIDPNPVTSALKVNNLLCKLSLAGAKSSILSVKHQSNSKLKLWFDFRSGRITGSKILVHAACHSPQNNSSLSRLTFKEKYDTVT